MLQESGKFKKRREMQTTNSIFNRGVSIIVIALCFAEALFAGAWTQRKDHYYFRLSGFSFHSRAIFDKSGNRVDLTDSGRFTDIARMLITNKAHAQVILHVGKGMDVAFIYENLLAGRNTTVGRSIGVALAFFSANP
jgi:hypothetical protein